MGKLAAKLPENHGKSPRKAQNAQKNGQSRKNGKKCGEAAKRDGGKDKLRGLAKRTAQFPPKPDPRTQGAKTRSPNGTPQRGDPRRRRRPAQENEHHRKRRLREHGSRTRLRSHPLVCVADPRPTAPKNGGMRGRARTRSPATDTKKERGASGPKPPKGAGGKAAGFAGGEPQPPSNSAELASGAIKAGGIIARAGTRATPQQRRFLFSS